MWRKAAWILALSVAWLAPVTLTCRAADDATVGYSEIKSALVKVWALDSSDRPIRSGTGFIVASDATRSWILTAEHVVGGASRIVINVAGDRRDLEATVANKGPYDSALLRVSHGRLTPVEFASKTHELLDGSYVAVAGFPKHDESVAVVGQNARLFGPGTVTLVNDGKLIDLANLTIEEGLSGAPVFDPRTGEVVGMVSTRQSDARGGYAVSAAQVLLGFLSANEVHIVYHAAAEQVPRAAMNVAPIPQATLATILRPPTSQPAPQGIVQDIPGAGRAVIIYNTTGATGSGPQAVVDSAQDFAQKFGQRFGISAFAASGQFSSGAILGEEARQNNAIASVQFAVSFRPLDSRSTQYVTRTRWQFTLKTAIVDSFGAVWYAAEVSKTVTSLRDPISAIVSSLADLSDQSVTLLSQKMLEGAKDDSVIANFFRYSVPIANGDRKTFVALTPAGAAAKVQFIEPFSRAKETGLQVGDIVVAVDGTPTSGKTQQELVEMQISANRGEMVDYEIVGTDGRHVHVQFRPQGVSWYVQRRQQLNQ